MAAGLAFFEESKAQVLLPGPWNMSGSVTLLDVEP
jgi:hypothetical protein